MSRIDKALQRWEKKDAAPETADRFELGRYTNERSTVASAAPQPPAQPPAPPGPMPPSQNGHGQPKGASRTRVSADIEARLVTGGSGAVPLEQYRRLAAVLHDIQLQQGLKTLMLTSALPAEGKTLTTINLALTLSESYARRVLIVDADLRWPSIHRMFGLANSAGLSESLQADGKDLPFHHISPTLAVLTAGNPGVTPLAGLTSQRMSEVIELCANQFDWVILDTPPVGLLPDAQLLARLTRAVVFVIEAGATSSVAIQRAIGELGPDCIIGTVLNRVEDRRIPEAGYYSHYDYGYDDKSST